ncbi:unnamed protein product [Didymodactylos carnosus]|uniref:Uncharacterized protein n=1 Tax=Didymodactylos carnosus TaxID=1234261 RepID=A0A815FZN0_9BILA|nr:unnamed protein product [Didymodactylos carnosus]CAF4186392.1 unnamed protein product [Didymodactylos carnosus]
MSASTAWLLAVGIIFMSAFSSFIYHPYFYQIQLCAIQLRVAYSGLLYRKVLRLSSRSTNTMSSGQIINLLSNDVSQIEPALYFINYIWVAPLEVIIVVLIFWHFVKWISFIAIGYTLFLLLSQFFYGQLSIRLRTRILSVTDERVKIMSEIIKSMRIVKMYCWEGPFEQQIKNIRKREIIQLSYRLLLNCVQTLFSHTYIYVTFLMMYATMWSLNIQFDTRFFAIASCLLGYVRWVVMDCFNYAIRNLVQYVAAKRRIETFLLADESERDDRIRSPSNLESDLSSVELLPNVSSSSYLSTNRIDKNHSPSSLSCHLKIAQWKQDSSFALKNIVFDAHPGDLVCVIGPVGSGKSSLLQTLSGEVAYFEGKIRLHRTFCYVPQESWIFSSSLKQNILFGKKYDSKLFQKVVHASALEEDFLQLQHGEHTIIGDQGVMLSGGQKARVNLARALYRDADIYFLDDPLSAVDVKVSNHLFEKCIKTYLKNKICILVTHQVQFIKDATKVIVLKNGEAVQQGIYQELLQHSTSFAKLLEDIHQHEQDTASITSNEEKKHVSVGKNDNDEMIEISEHTLQTQLSSLQEDEPSPPTPTDFQQGETKAIGNVKFRDYLDYFRAGAGLLMAFILIFVIFSMQQATAIFSNWWLVKWSDEESFRHSVIPKSSNCSSPLSKVGSKIKTMSDAQWHLHRNEKFYIYCGIIVILFIITLIRIVATEFLCLNAARVLHDR